MDRLKRGFIFLSQAGQIARTYPFTLQPLAVLAGAGLALALAAAVLAALSLAFLGGFGEGLAGFLLALLVAGLLLAGYGASVEIARRVYEVSAPVAASATAPAWGVLRSSGMDLAALAVASVLIPLLRRVPASWGSGATAGEWSRAVELVPAAMAVEGLGLKQGLARASQMVCENRLFIRPGEVAVTWASALPGILFWVGGILLGWGAGRGVALSSWSSPFKPFTALAVGVLIASLCILISIALSIYGAAAYRACLYAWARQLEAAGGTDAMPAVEPPAALAAALAGLDSLSAPLFSDNIP